MKELLVIVPTRGRPNKSVEFYEAFKENSDLGFTDLLFGLDDDDIEYPRLPGVLYSVNPRLRMNGTLNKLALENAACYKYIAFLGDDHRVRTKNWDRILANSIQDFGLAYGNDLFQGRALATSVMMSSNIISELGYMAPPELIHLFLDVFWMQTGQALKKITYHHNVIIEHLHPYAGKNEMDSGYWECNAKTLHDKDQESYKRYKETRFESDMEKLRKLLGDKK